MLFQSGNGATHSHPLGRIFTAEVVFFSGTRKTVPVPGYRPHIIMDDDPGREYLGVRFLNIEIPALDEKGRAQCECMYEDLGVGYQKVAAKKTFRVVEGPHVVGAGTVLEE